MVGVARCWYCAVAATVVLKALGDECGFFGIIQPGFYRYLEMILARL